MSKELYAEGGDPKGDEVHVTPAMPLEDVPPRRRKIGEGRWWRCFFEPGSAPQIIIAAIVALAIGLGVNVSVETVPQAAIAIVGIPGRLWLRALQAVVLPLIVTAMILAVQRLKDMTKGGAILAKWLIFWYIITAMVAIAHSMVMVEFVWRRQMRQVSEDSLVVSGSLSDTIEERSKTEIYQVVVDTFDSFVPNNIVAALANNALLSVLMVAILFGYLIKGPNSSLLRATIEVERIVTVIIVALIKLAPIGVFFLILSNIMRLNIADVGINLGVLVGGAVAQMLFHLLVLLPAAYFLIVRKNPYTMWFKASKAWITAWGTASSAGTLPVTMKCCIEGGVPLNITKFAVPLGCLVNMDGTAIYFPIVVVFMAQTQGIVLNAAEYVIVFLLATLASIGVSPIPSASLVIVVMICGAVNIPVTGMYAVVVAIDWFTDRFRTATNVSGDLFAAHILQKLTGVVDTEEENETAENVINEGQAMYDRETRREDDVVAR